MKKLIKVMQIATVAICSMNIAFAQDTEKKTETKTTTKKVVKKKPHGKKTTVTKEQKVKTEKMEKQ